MCVLPALAWPMRDLNSPHLQVEALDLIGVGVRLQDPVVLRVPAPGFIKNGLCQILGHGVQLGGHPRCIQRKQALRLSVITAVCDAQEAATVPAPSTHALNTNKLTSSHLPPEQPLPGPLPYGRAG